MAQDEQTTEEHSTLEQQSPGRLDHPVVRHVVVPCYDLQPGICGSVDGCLMCCRITLMLGR